MQAQISDITGRAKTFPAALAALEDFELTNSRTTDAAIVLSEPGWSLYSVDFEKGVATFVLTPPETDLSSAVFVYSAQFELAQQVLVLSLDDMITLADQITPPENLGILFSTGRCGSTLASRILAQIPDVWSISEPDALTNLSFARHGADRSKIVALISAAVRFLAQPPAHVSASTVIIKPRSEAVAQAPEYADAIPQSRNIFLYRDAERFVDSLYRFAQRVMGPEMFDSPEGREVAWMLSSANAPKDLRHDFFKPDEDLGLIEIMLMGWVLRMRAYRAAAERGLPIAPLHYADLNADRPEYTGKMLAEFGLPADHLDLALRGFEEDAHAGSKGANEVPAKKIDAAQIARTAELLERWGEESYATTRLARS